MLRIVGMIVTAIGVIWMAQGLGLLRWPPESFMIDDRPWIGWGAATGLVGIALLVVSRRR